MNLIAMEWSKCTPSLYCLFMNKALSKEPLQSAEDFSNAPQQTLSYISIASVECPPDRCKKLEQYFQSL